MLWQIADAHGETHPPGELRRDRVHSCLRSVTAVRTPATNTLAAMRQRTRGNDPRRTTCSIQRFEGRPCCSTPL